LGKWTATGWRELRTEGLSLSMKWAFWVMRSTMLLVSLASK